MRSALLSSCVVPIATVKTGHILHVEDDDNDVVFLTLAAENAGLQKPILVATDGQEAINLLSAAVARSDHSPAALPCLILLDVNLPSVHGIEVLRWIRKQRALDPVPVLVLSGSDQSSHLQLAHELGAESFFIKPCSLSEHLAFATHLRSWILGQGPLPSSPGWRAASLNAVAQSRFAGFFLWLCVLFGVAFFLVFGFVALRLVFFFFLFFFFVFVHPG